MPGRILVVEDNPANLDLMAFLLAAFGHTVLTAADGAEGVALVGRELPDLVLCDVELPGMTGYEVARVLKGQPAWRTIPLVAVTAFAMVGDRDKLLAAGFDAYLAKPIDPETFVGQVEVFLPPDQRSTRPPAEAATVPASSPPALRGTVLVVDNLPVQLDLARLLLEPFGYRVSTAGGMHEALALARQDPPDLILSDVCMGEDSGYDFIRAVKADPRLRSIPFLFITSTLLTAKDQARGLALGAARFLMRPIEAEALLAEIQACLEGNEARPP